MKKSNLYIGIMSGTSCDGINLALTQITNIKKPPKIIDHAAENFTADLQQEIHTLINQDLHSFLQLGQVDRKLAIVYARAVNNLLAKNKLHPSDIAAIGCHGQTVYHAPTADLPFTMQLGDPNTLAVMTNIDVICDFRRRDIALGGHGAPLVPIFHNIVFKHRLKKRAIINIGGIANITYLDRTNILGFDVGPGNTLMDLWVKQHLNKNFDDNGKWAKSGKVNQKLLSNLLKHSFFTQHPPKSTGRELFNLQYLKNNLLDLTVSPVDVQATLCEFSAQSINLALRNFCHHAQEIFLCGGGAKNSFLCDRIAALTKLPTKNTSALGLDPQLVEACAFAWLAFCHIHKIKFDLSKISGSQKEVLLGGLYYS